MIVFLNVEESNVALWVSENMEVGSIMDAPTIVPRQGVVTLCGVQGCCPTVDFDTPDEVQIKDDHGGHVRLTHAQWADLEKLCRG